MTVGYGWSLPPLLWPQSGAGDGGASSEASPERETGLRAGGQNPRNGEDDGKGLCRRGAGRLEKPVKKQQLLLHPAARLVLSRLRFRLPPPAELSRQLPISPVPKAGPGSRAGGELLGSLMLQLALRPSQQLNEEDALLCLS